MFSPSYGGVKWYTEGIARFAVYFPEGEACCNTCPFCRSREGFDNYRCALTDVFIHRADLKQRHPVCPIEFPETEF